MKFVAVVSSSVLAFLTLAPCAACAQAASPTDIEHAEAVGALSKRVYETFEPAGMAVAVVRGGETIYAGGFGRLRYDRPNAVTSRSLFSMASTSKAFTAAALAVLIDDGKLAWDDKVVDHLPAFKLKDPWVTSEFTVRDLLTHRSGLPTGAGDLLFWPDGTASRAEMVEALRHFDFETSFRSAFAYDNLLYVVAGEVIAAVSGMAYEDFVETRILDGLGMTGCRAGFARLPEGAEVAYPHSTDSGQRVLVPMDFSRLDEAIAAGGIVCDAVGMAEWAKMLLNEGAAADGSRFMSPSRVAEMFAPVTPLEIGRSDRYVRGSNLKSYALGWFVQDAHGELLVHHPGSNLGHISWLGLLPDQKTAIVVMVNDYSAAMQAAADALLLHFTKPDGIDARIESIERRDAERQAQSNAPVSAAARLSGPPSLPLDAYAGIYRDPWYGTVEVTELDGGLHLAMSRSRSLQGPLDHVRFNTWIARWAQPGLDADAYVTFHLGHDGQVERIEMDAMSPYTDFSYNFHDLDLRPVRE